MAKVSDILERQHLKIFSTHLNDWSSWREEIIYQMQGFVL